MDWPYSKTLAKNYFVSLKSLFLEKEKGLVDVEDEVAPVEAVGRFVCGRVLVGDG